MEKQELVCSKHGLTLHYKDTSGRIRWRCYTCASERANKSRRARKAKCVTALGGKCERCGYDKCQSALEFHHKNPDEKDFSFRESRGFTDEEIANELKKCELLCANCHREVHEEMGW